jgi:hypothetical protein
MKTAAKPELILIAIATAVPAVFRGHLPQEIEAGYLVLSFGLLFLFQTLLRDIWLLFKLRTKSRASLPAGSCMCLESAIGFIPVTAAAVLLFSGLSRPINIPSWVWPVGTAITLSAGFWLKDYVFEWKPLRIRKDPDHINLRFSWKSG